MTERLPADQPSPRRVRRRYGVILAAVVAATLGVAIYVWPDQSSTLSYVDAQDKTRESLDDATYAAIGSFSDPAFIHEDYNPCAGSQGLHSMSTHTNVPGLTLNDATQAATKLATFLRSKAYTDVHENRSAVSVTVSGVKDRVTTTMLYDADGLAFSAATGCDVKQ